MRQHPIVTPANGSLPLRTSWDATAGTTTAMQSQCLYSPSNLRTCTDSLIESNRWIHTMTDPGCRGDGPTPSSWCSALCPGQSRPNRRALSCSMTKSLMNMSWYFLSIEAWMSHRVPQNQWALMVDNPCHQRNKLQLSAMSGHSLCPKCCHMTSSHCSHLL
jgi:hypothetical protein